MYYKNEPLLVNFKLAKFHYYLLPTDSVILDHSDHTVCYKSESKPSLLFICNSKYIFKRASKGFYPQK
jgi:hypothetical protein